MKFARVFDFKAGQLLMSITTDSDVEGYVLSLETYYQGAFIRTGLPFTTFGDASESMDDLTDQRAEQLFISLIQAIGNPSTITIGKGQQEALESFEKWLQRK